ncbi:MAG: flagellar biosynthesis protein FlhF [Phycisphaerales bacterium]|nr:flagellar biosynthesis protein FlhF [Phycisphaerales bacterium]
MATTTLKTYHGDSMADALAEVKKDLGADAVILHTRSFRVGGVMGVGARNRVEITASAESPQFAPKRIRPREMSAAGGGTPAAPGQLGALLDPGRAAVGGTAEAFIPTPPWFQRQERTPPEVVVRGRPASSPVLAPSPNSASRDARTEGERAPPREPLASESVAAPAGPEIPAEPRRLSADTSRLSAGRVTPAPTTPRAQAALEEELAAIRRLVGQVLQSTRRAEARASSGSGGASPDAAVSTGPLFDLYMQLLNNQVSTEVADELTSAVRDELTAEELGDPGVVRDSLLRHLAKLIPVAPATTPAARAEIGRPSVIALIGPTGVGKTTTVAKLAANLKLRYGKKVGLITADTYRIAAVEQLRTYADIVGLPLKVVLSAQDLPGAIDSLGACDVVLLDTAGRSQHDSARLDELAELLDAAKPDACHLVLSLAAAESVIVAAAERFGALGPQKLILTKLDEAVEFGVIANIARRVRLPLSHVTTGQEVPDHIEPAGADRLARLVLDGAPAWRVPTGRA